MGGGGGTAATIQGKSVYYNVIGGEEEQLHQYRVSLFVLISLVEKSSGRERGGGQIMDYWCLKTYCFIYIIVVSFISGENH